MIYNYDILYERILYLFPRSYRMNNTDWKILIYLKEEKSINKVAKRLFMTQPSLTYRLGQMEKEIGIPLFIRTKAFILLMPVIDYIAMLKKSFNNIRI